MSTLETILIVFTCACVITTTIAISITCYSVKSFNNLRKEYRALGHKHSNLTSNLLELEEQIEDLEVYKKTCSKLALLLHERILQSTTAETNSAYLIIQDFLDKTVYKEHNKMERLIHLFNKDQ